MERSDGCGHRLDQRLREALEPSPGAADRIIRGALNPRGKREPALRLAPVLTVLTVLGLVAGLLVLPFRSPRQEAAEAGIAIENVGDLLVVHHREGGRWLIRKGGPAESSLPSRSLIVIYGGKP